jgi:hypothetical protein
MAENMLKKTNVQTIHASFVPKPLLEMLDNLSLNSRLYPKSLWNNNISRPFGHPRTMKIPPAHGEARLWRLTLILSPRGEGRGEG